MTSLLRTTAGILLLAGLTGCGSSNELGQVSIPVTETRAGTERQVVIPSPFDGADISFQLFEPDQLVTGQSYPLVLEGHGYAGARRTVREGFIARLTAAGYYVISIDQRGFGASGGTVRVMGPETEGADLVAILDWAESLPGLQRRGNGEMLVGSYGGSYGGMYQLLLAGADPRQRLRVLAPDITPHNLVYALNPQNVIKSGWALVLVAGGEASGVTSLLQGVAPTGTNQDTAIIETLLQGSLTNVFPEAGKAYFDYHSVSYFCRGEPARPQDFILARPDAGTVPPSAFAPIDVLLTQGFLDTLFNFNDGLNNYDCLRERGGDVRLLTHQSGHILPVALPDDALTALDPFFAALTIPQFQAAGGSRRCGSLNLDDVQFAWFEEKLRGQSGAVDAALPIGQEPCISLAEDDAITVREIKRGGSSFEIASTVPQFNSVLGVVGSLLGSEARELLLADQILMTMAQDSILAGLPLLNITVSSAGGLPVLDDCPTPLALGACDPIYFVGLGRRPAGQSRWVLIDDQVTPIRGFGTHEVAMNGVAERLQAGDELGLLIYGFHAQFPITWSRDLILPATTLSGQVEVPLLSPGEITAEGV